MGFFDSLQSGDIGGLLGTVGQGLADRRGLLYGIAANGFAGANEGRQSDQNAQLLKQKQQERELKRQALLAYAQANGIDPGLAQDEHTLQMQVDAKRHEELMKHQAAQEANANAHWGADYNLRRSSFDETVNQRNEANRRADAELDLRRTAPKEYDPDKVYMRPDGTRVDLGFGSSPDGGSFGGGSGVTAPADLSRAMRPLPPGADRKEWIKAETKRLAEEGSKNDALPGELAARLGLARAYEKAFPRIEKDLLARDPRGAGPIDSMGLGQAGAIQRDIKMGSEAMVRMLTGAGMNEAEAKDRVKQYEAGVWDSPEAVLDKQYRLRAALRDMQREALRGRRGQAQIDAEYPELQSPSYDEVVQRRRSGGEPTASAPFSREQILAEIQRRRAARTAGQ